MCFGRKKSKAPAPRQYEPYASPNVDPVAITQGASSESSPVTGTNPTSPTTNSNTGLSIN